jgi:hypothetical protein
VTQKGSTSLKKQKKWQAKWRNIFVVSLMQNLYKYNPKHKPKLLQHI